MTAERPRDRLGRPLPADSAPDPSIPPVPDVRDLHDTEVLDLALRFVSDGLPFHAHEVCEQRWRTASESDREVWRALAQWGAAETHAARGNAEGAHRLAERALTGLSDGDLEQNGLALTEVRSRCLALARQ